MAIKFLVNDSLTIAEIATLLNSTEMTIYRDLTSRINQLEEVDNKTKKAVLLKLKEHSLNNLKNRGR